MTMAPTTCGRHRWTIKMHCEQESHRKSFSFFSLSLFLSRCLSLFLSFSRRETTREIFIPSDGFPFEQNNLSFRDINTDLLLVTFLLTVHISLRKRPMAFAASCPVSSCFSLWFVPDRCTAICRTPIFSPSIRRDICLHQT